MEKKRYLIYKRQVIETAYVVEADSRGEALFYAKGAEGNVDPATEYQFGEPAVVKEHYTVRLHPKQKDEPSG